MLSEAGCAGAKLYGVTAEDEFSDPGVVALIEAIDANRLDEIDALVKRGVDIHTVGKRGSTPLAWSVAAKKKAAFQRLLERGADPNAIVPVLHGGKSVTHMLAGGYYSIEMLEIALKHGGDPNRTTDRKEAGHRESPLELATLIRDFEKVKLLIKYGADVNQPDIGGGGHTAVHNAAALGAYDYAAYMLDHGYRRDDDRLEDLARQIMRHIVNEKGKRKRQILIDKLKAMDVKDEVFIVEQKKRRRPSLGP